MRTITLSSKVVASALLALSCVTIAGLALPRVFAVDDQVLKAQSDRVKVIEKVKNSVVAVCIYGGQGIGSGVIITPDGYALTNYHVTESVSPVMQAGLADGELYDAVLVGQDKVGDVALIKLLPKVPNKPFTYAKLGDSDAVSIGDWSLAMGNPFSLAMDFTPTVTFGLISGTNRYQPPEGGGLEYTDCIQIDTSINPGNSGGPLFNMSGELIGINGRGSFEKRGRVNSGVGYAISINQIKNFMGHLYGGHDIDHATLGVQVETDAQNTDLAQLVIKDMLDDSDAFRRGLSVGDRLVSFANRSLTSTNHYKNILGTLPSGWRVPITIRRDNLRKNYFVRLMGYQDERPSTEAKPKGPARPDPAKEKAKLSPAMKFFKEKKGYANYYFNEQQVQEVMTKFHTHGDYQGTPSQWVVTGDFKANERQGAFRLTMKTGADGNPDLLLSMNVDFQLRPIQTDITNRELQVPDNSGGLLAALYQYKRFLQEGVKGFEGGFEQVGLEPIYPQRFVAEPTAKPVTPTRLLCPTLRTKHAATECKWSFHPETGLLLVCEAQVLRDDDSCEILFEDYRDVSGRKFPHSLTVRYGDRVYGRLNVQSIEMK